MLETRDVLTLLSILVAAVSIVLVSRNARKATAVQMRNVDLTQIRDLRHELSETKSELKETRAEVRHAKAEAEGLSAQVQAMSDALTEAYRKQQEMILYARMPGVEMADWLERFDVPPELGNRVGR